MSNIDPELLQPLQGLSWGDIEIVEGSYRDGYTFRRVGDPSITYQATAGTITSATRTGGDSGGTRDSNAPSLAEGQNALESVKAAFPWVDQLGLTQQLLGWIRDGYSGQALVSLIRQTPEHQSFFVGLRRDNGTLRMNEAQYLQTKQNYRTLLKQHGRRDYEYDNPEDFRAFFENEISPNELQQRLETYNEIRRSGQPVRDAFYVYAGMRLSDDDLYSLAVNPDRRQEILQEYEERSAKQPLDYETWITRATEAGLNRVVETLNRLDQQGLDTGGAIQAVQRVNPEFARSMADLLFRGESEDRFLNLDELLTSFETALIGSAASASGLALPTMERVAAMRQAGINRAQALQGYSEFARNRGLFKGAVQRSNLARDFTQSDFEEAVFLSQAEEADLLARGLGREEAIGRSGGSFGFAQGRNAGSLMQPGFRR